MSAAPAQSSPAQAVLPLPLKRRRGCIVFGTPAYAERFEAKYVPEPNTGCYLWLGTVNEWGYGRVALTRPGQRCTSDRAHRVAWEMEYGPIPAGLEVCHRCDQPSCVNPRHFFLGTRAVNHADMRAKGRHNIGERNGNAKLTRELVLELHSRASQGESAAELAARFGVGVDAVQQVRRGRRWGHLHPSRRAGGS